MKEATNTHGYKSIYTLYYTPTTTQWYGVQLEWKFIRNDGKQKIFRQKHNQLRLWTTLNSNTTRRKTIRKIEQVITQGKRGQKERVLNARKETQGVEINLCTTESASSSIFSSIETSLKPYQKYLGTFERVVWWSAIWNIASLVRTLLFWCSKLNSS